MLLNAPKRLDIEGFGIREEICECMICIIWVCRKLEDHVVRLSVFAFSDSFISYASSSEA